MTADRAAWLIVLCAACTARQPSQESTRDYGTIGLPRLGAAARPRCDGGAYDQPELVTTRLVTRGALDEAAVVRALRRHRQKLIYCFEREPNPGSWTADIEVGGDGRVVTAAVTPRDWKCAREVLGRYEFPRPADGARTHVTITFEYKPAQHPRPLGCDAD